jgi:hypothetical protein
LIHSLLLRYPGQGHTFIVEKQLAFTAPGRQFASTVNVSIETAWHAILITKGIQCVTVDARLVKRYFELPDGPPKKKAAVAVVQNMIDTSTLRCNQAVRDKFKTTRKKDDLADALLQGLYHMNS